PGWVDLDGGQDFGRQLDVLAHDFAYAGGVGRLFDEVCALDNGLLKPAGGSLVLGYPVAARAVQYRRHAVRKFRGVVCGYVADAGSDDARHERIGRNHGIERAAAQQVAMLGKRSLDEVDLVVVDALEFEPRAEGNVQI